MLNHDDVNEGVARTGRVSAVPSAPAGELHEDHCVAQGLTWCSGFVSGPQALVRVLLEVVHAGVVTALDQYVHCRLQATLTSYLN